MIASPEIKVGSAAFSRIYDYRSVSESAPLDEDPVSVGLSKSIIEGDSQVVRLELVGTVRLAYDGVQLYVEDNVKEAWGWSLKERIKPLEHRIIPRRRAWVQGNGDVYHQNIGRYFGTETTKLVVDSTEVISADWLYSSILPSRVASSFGLRSRLAGNDVVRSSDRLLVECPGTNPRERPDLESEGVVAFEYNRSLLEVFGATMEDFDTMKTVALFEEATGLPIEIDVTFVQSEGRQVSELPFSYRRFAWNTSEGEAVLIESVEANGAHAHMAVRNVADPWSVADLPAGVTLLRLSDREEGRSDVTLGIPELPQTRFLLDGSNAQLGTIELE